MKKLNLILTLLLAGMSLWAGPVKQDAARQKAADFLIQQRFRNTSSSGRHETAPVPQVLTLAESTRAYHVFNVGEDGGYVIVSGDDRMPDILGYAESGAYDADNMPDNMRLWMEGYADQVAYLEAGGPALAASRREAPTEVVKPLIQTKWNQRAPYNNLCPIISGQRVPTGCVATAMAQIMYFYQWPATTTAVIPSYTTESHQKEQNELPITAIDWDNMRLSYSSSYTTAQATAVATLMELCGKAIKMNYAPGNSEAYFYDVIAAMPAYFDYEADLRQIPRDSYSAEQWEEIIVHELASERPVMYSAEKSAPGSGHAFLLDGYNGNGYFHVNWGWGGNQDGYFRLTSLNGYNYYHWALIGIQPTQSDMPKAYATLEDGTLTFYYDTLKDTRTATTYTICEFYSETGLAWSDRASEITKVVFDSSFADHIPLETVGWFSDFENLKAIEGLDYLNTSYVHDMSWMFYGCSALTSLDLSHFDTSNVTDMSGLFTNCSNLTQLDISNFQTDKVYSMYAMFERCSSLKSLDLSHFYTQKVNNMSQMFAGCKNLTAIYAGDGWNIGNVEYSSDMFYGTTALKGEQGTAYNSSHTDVAYAHIDEGLSNPGYLSHPASTGIAAPISHGRTEQHDVWHTLGGVKLPAAPTKPGLYIRNGKTITR